MKARWPALREWRKKEKRKFAPFVYTLGAGGVLNFSDFLFIFLRDLFLKFN